MHRRFWLTICLAAAGCALRSSPVSYTHLSKEGLQARDRLIFSAAARRGIPIAVVLAGGYARYLEDTVEIHANTAVALLESLRPAGA